MLNLKSNWDGYNADPIVPEAVEVAKEFVGVLHSLLGRGGDETGMYVHPGRDGSVMVAWDDEEAEYEMDINTDGSFGLLREDKLTGVMAEQAFPALSECKHWLSAARRAGSVSDRRVEIAASHT